MSKPLIVKSRKGNSNIRIVYRNQNPKKAEVDNTKIEFYYDKYGQLNTRKVFKDKI